MRKAVFPVCLASIASIAASASSAASAVQAQTTTPPGFAVEKVVDGLDPAAMALAPDGRIFITEKHGRVRVVKNGRLLEGPFHTFAVDNVNERGLLGVAFHPDYANNKRIYFYYTAPTPKPHNRISYIVDGGNDRAVGRETIILDLTVLSNLGNHNGGAILFGGDGKLYASAGENANGKNAQDPTNLLGKILRMNDDGSVPDDNPFVRDPAFTGASRLIYCLGLRNPYGLAWQNETGRLFINDVGAGRWEEIDEARPGRNFGWPDTEGTFVQGKFPRFVNPVFAYPHTESKNAITGGAFYGARTGGFPAAYVGKYFYGDYGGNYIGVFDPATGRSVDFITGIKTRPIALTVAPDGVLYYLARGGMGGGSVPDNTASTSGSLWAVRYTGIMPPALALSAETVTVAEGAHAALTVRLSRPTPAAIKVTVTKVAGAANLSISPASLLLGAGLRPLTGTLNLSCARDPDSADGLALFSVTAPGMAPKAVRVTCTDPDRVATITSRPSLSAIVGVAYRYPLSATGKPHPTLALRKGPAGMTFDVASAQLHWTPTAAAPAQVVVQARNGSGRDAVQTFDIAVLPADAPFGLAGREPVRPFLSMPDSAAGVLPARLSQTGAFADVAGLVPAQGLLPYDVNSPLWSDGAAKRRWIAVPNDGAPYQPWEQIGFAATGEWTFPRGTVFVKHFELPGAPAVRLETRLLVVDAVGGVYGVTYKWRADGSDADLLPAALDEDHVVAAANGPRTQIWSYPGRADCLVCHTATAGHVLGVNTRQLNRGFGYGGGARPAQQLTTWAHLGLFAPGSFKDSELGGYARLAEISATTVDAGLRVRSYLDANCGFCHRPGGAPTPFDFRFDTPLDRQGIIGAPVVSNFGMGGMRLVAPGDLRHSMLPLRMGAQDTSRMPPLARNTPDQDALALMALWIAGAGLEP